MFIKFAEKLHNISAIMMVERHRTEGDFPTYEIKLIGSTGTILGKETYTTIQQCNHRFRQIQTNLGAEDVYIGGGGHSGSCGE